MNKKGQVGKILADYVVLIVIIVIMLGFVLVSNALSIKGPAGGVGATRNIDNSFLFDIIEVRGENLSVLDGVILARSSELERMDKTLALRNGIVSGEGARLLEEELEGKLTDRVDGAAIRSTYTRDLREGVFKKLERDRGGISGEYCLILVDSDNPQSFIFNSGLKSTSMFFEVRDGNVKELVDSEAIDKVRSYRSKGFLTETKFNARLSYELFYNKNPEAFSSQGGSSRLKFANEFALYYYYGLCRSKEELR